MAERMVNGEAIRHRNKRSMALSALRSWLFNEMLSTRLETEQFDTVIDGDALVLSGSNSFLCTIKRVLMSAIYALKSAMLRRMFVLQHHCGERENLLQKSGIGFRAKRRV